MESQSLKFRCSVNDLIAATEKKSGLSEIVISSADDLNNTVNYLLGILGATKAYVNDATTISIRAVNSSLEGDDAIINIVMRISS